MRKTIKLADKYFGMAEKIVDGLIKSKTCLDEGAYLYFHEISKIDLINAIANAIKTNLTYGNLGTLTLRNNLGQIVAKMYILPDGTLAEDSWVCNLGLGTQKTYTKINDKKALLSLGWGNKPKQSQVEITNIEDETDINVAPTSDDEEAPATPE